MSLLHPSAAAVSSLALCALLGCEHKLESGTPRGSELAPAVATPALRTRKAADHEPQGSLTSHTAQGSLTARSEPQGSPTSHSAQSSLTARNAQDSLTARSSAGSDSAPAEHARDELDPLAAPTQRVSGSDGAASATCIHGWTAPPRGSSLRKAALDMMRQRRNERFVVLDIRYFRGPEDAEVIGPPREVERWYIKGYSAARHGRRQRWLVRRAPVGSGIDAVAPFDSSGYGPGIWRRPDALDETLSDPFQRPCDRARPGEKCMGLPQEVLGCLQGT